MKRLYDKWWKRVLIGVAVAGFILLLLRLTGAMILFAVGITLGFALGFMAAKAITFKPKE